MGLLASERSSVLWHAVDFFIRSLIPLNWVRAPFIAKKRRWKKSSFEKTSILTIHFSHVLIWKWQVSEMTRLDLFIMDCLKAKLMMSLTYLLYSENPNLSLVRKISKINFKDKAREFEGKAGTEHFPFIRLGIFTHYLPVCQHEIAAMIHINEPMDPIEAKSAWRG